MQDKWQNNIQGLIFKIKNHVFIYLIKNNNNKSDTLVLSSITLPLPLHTTILPSSSHGRRHPPPPRRHPTPPSPSITSFNFEEYCCLDLKF